MNVYIVVNKANALVAGVFEDFQACMNHFASRESGTTKIEYTAQGAIFHREWEKFEATFHEVVEADRFFTQEALYKLKDEAGRDVDPEVLSILRGE
jgi:hypothetical protein